MLLLVLEPITRAGARDAAREELSKGIYQAARPSLLEQALDRLSTFLNSNIDRLSQAAPGGLWGILAVVVVLVAVIVVVRVKTGPLGRGGRAGDPFAGFAAALSPTEHRLRADEHAAAGRYPEAVREFLRAIVRDLEDRAVLEPRLGRTADEVAYEAGRVLPDSATDLQRAARMFDDVWYGGRPATAAMVSDLRLIDRQVHAARPSRDASPVASVTSR